MAVKFLDYYATLGVARTATAEEIKLSFRKLARIHHPDVAKDKDAGEAKFKELNEAYEVLSDAFSRYDYDLNYFKANLPVPVGGNALPKKASLWSFVKATLFKHYRPVFITLVGISIFTILLSLLTLSKKPTPVVFSKPVNLKLHSPEHALFLDFCISYPGLISKSEFYEVFEHPLPQGFSVQLEAFAHQGDTTAIKEWITSIANQ
jgi:curved DNA-binding protein CbpA